ncbi:hypothetical protein [Methylobacterium aerolatum]|uniref:Uncharacterized protein n=1 Tax=Methylobacterium aerolatum TaxID=418708 RepID=A0ABU0HUN6_9HYPH|nr:hypothetical protein [Methylobacterium aerolatum]MDQ0446033.1 hypothetical protein [Methylobacterium aerolatum]GJD35069.1 hypothetical protein FMGBMHLM_1976 [Methylobacterium aerolatum]
MPDKTSGSAPSPAGEADEVAHATGIRRRTFIRHCVLTPVVCVWTLYGALRLSAVEGVFASIAFRALSLTFFIGFSFLLMKSVVNFVQLLMHYGMCKDFGFLNAGQKHDMVSALSAALYANLVSVANVSQIFYADKAWVLLAVETVIWLCVEWRFRARMFPAGVAAGPV